MFHLLRLVPLLLNYDFKDICKYIFIFLIIFLVYLAFESTQIKEHCNEHIHLKKDSNGFSKIIS